MTQEEVGHRPQLLTIEREQGLLDIVWEDGHRSRFPLSWVRHVCPCASCREERRDAGVDPLRLNSGPPPSPEVADAELVGNYAIRFTWRDGHDSGIYTFGALRASCPCPECGGPKKTELTALP